MIRTIVMATVLALVAGGFRIVTRPMERMMARAIRTICVMWMRNFQLSSKERIEEISCILVLDDLLSFWIVDGKMCSTGVKKM